jgi:hypothetical protein
MNTAIQGGIESLRKRSASAYKRQFFFLDVLPRQQSYELSNRRIGYHKIVHVMAAYRFTSAFLSTAHASGHYGQMAIQNLYHMGTYDLTSYYLVAQYIETLEEMFATRLTFNWYEDTRILNFYQAFYHPERVIIDCTVEKTDQELLKDRYTKTWIERFATAEAMYTLGMIRSKYASLPGAGGSISLNADLLISEANAMKIDLYQQLDDYLANDITQYGMEAGMAIG